MCELRWHFGRYVKVLFSKVDIVHKVAEVDVRSRLSIGKAVESCKESFLLLAELCLDMVELLSHCRELFAFDVSCPAFVIEFVEGQLQTVLQAVVVARRGELVCEVLLSCIQLGSLVQQPFQSARHDADLTGESFAGCLQRLRDSFNFRLAAGNRALSTGESVPLGRQLIPHLLQLSLSAGEP